MEFITHPHNTHLDSIQIRSWGSHVHTHLLLKGYGCSINTYLREGLKQQLILLRTIFNLYMILTRSTHSPSLYHTTTSLNPKFLGLAMDPQHIVRNKASQMFFFLHFIIFESVFSITFLIDKFVNQTQKHHHIEIITVRSSALKLN